MLELDRIAKSILKLEKIKCNNYGEFLSELLKLNGDQIPIRYSPSVTV